MLVKSCRKPRRWITLIAVACCLAACASQDPSPEVEDASRSPEGRAAGVGSDADDTPEAAATRSGDGSVLVPISGCKVYAQQANGQIRWYTRGGSQYCQAWIHRYESNPGYQLITTDGSYYSEWYTAESGDEVCVNNRVGQLRCEPDK